MEDCRNCRDGRIPTCTTAPAPVHLHQCTSAPVHQCTSAPVHQCTSAPVHQCTSAPAPVHLHQCTSAPAPVHLHHLHLHQCTCTNLHQPSAASGSHTVDPGSPWLLLLFCAAPRANNFLRVVHPSCSESFARQHDTRNWESFSVLLGQLPHRQHGKSTAFLCALEDWTRCSLGELGRLLADDQRTP